MTRFQERLPQGQINIMAFILITTINGVITPHTVIGLSTSILFLYMDEFHKNSIGFSMVDLLSKELL